MVSWLPSGVSCLSLEAATIISTRPGLHGGPHVYVETNASGELHGKRGQFSVKAESRPAGFSNSPTSYPSVIIGATSLSLFDFKTVTS